MSYCCFLTIMGTKIKIHFDQTNHLLSWLRVRAIGWLTNVDLHVKNKMRLYLKYIFAFNLHQKFRWKHRNVLWRDNGSTLNVYFEFSCCKIDIMIGNENTYPIRNNHLISYQKLISFIVFRHSIQRFVCFSCFLWLQQSEYTISLHMGVMIPSVNYAWYPFNVFRNSSINSGKS